MATMEEAKAALEAYPFFVANDDRTLFTRVKPGGRVTDRYEVVDGGFRRSYKGEPVPHSVAAKWVGVNGLDHNNPAHGDCFEWVWSPDEIVKVYG